MNKKMTKRDGGRPQKRRKVKEEMNEEVDEEIDSGSDSDMSIDGGINEDAMSSSEDETVQEKKIRLTKQYLKQLAERDERQSDSEDESGLDPLSMKLKKEQMEMFGHQHKDVADMYNIPDTTDIRVLRGHQLSVTCSVITQDDKYAFSGGKDCSLIKWDLATGKKVCTIHGGRKNTEVRHLGHTRHIMSMAVSSDGLYLATSDTSKAIFIWHADPLTFIQKLQHHRNAVSGLVFRQGTHQLFSASHDRSVKVWNIDEMAYTETLFGHEDVVTGIDCLSNERALTSGGRDCTMRVWKIQEESQLVFKGHMGSIDCCALLNESIFVSGGDDNTICLWSVKKKKPLYRVCPAHPGRSDDKQSCKNNWITALACLCRTDLIASGSKDGEIRLWKCTEKLTSLQLLFSIPMIGFVNSLKFSSKGDFLVAAVGQEHRLGRWWRIKEARNSVCVIKLSRK